MKTVDFEDLKRSPSKIVCVGRNFVEHIRELGNETPEEAVFFFKPNSAISDELRSEIDEPLHYEAEIALGVVDNRIRFVGFAFDLTKRQLQSKLKAKGLPWERCKAFSGSAVFSRFVEIDECLEALEVELWVDGALRQRGDVSMMIHKPLSILEEATRFTQLEDYDVILTGTPKGVGIVAPGAEYVGVIRNGGEELVRQSWRAT